MPQTVLAYTLPDGSDLRVSPFATNVSRAWVLNDVGTATFDLPAETPDLARVCQFGALHWLYEDGVPPFVGEVEQVSFSDTGTVSVGLRSAEYLLRGQITRQSVLFGESSPVSAGAVAAGVFESAVTRNGRSPLRPGVFDAENATFLKATYADCFDVFSKLTEDHKAAFWVDDHLRVHFRGRRGSDKRDSVLLFQGRNLLSATVTGSVADTINAAVVVADSNNPADGRTAALRYDTTGQFRAAVLTLSGAKDQAQARQFGVDTLRERRWPTMTLEGYVPRTAAEWGSFFLGDIVRVVTPLVPWKNEHICRVIAAELGPQEDQMRFVFSIINETAAETPATWVLT
jgi:hypothetical protein